LASELDLQVTGRYVETAAGRIEQDRSRALIEIEGRSEIVPVLLSDIVDKVLIGVTTLEVLGLRVDPVTGKLVEWTILMF